MKARWRGAIVLAFRRDLAYALGRPMLILGIHSGYHDACAALFDGYRLVAAVAQERLTRVKLDGGRLPREAIAEVLGSAGAAAADIEAIALSRSVYPLRFYTHLPLRRRLGRAINRIRGRDKMKSLERECVRYRRADSGAMFDARAFLAEAGLPPGAATHFYNHHRAHALAALFHTDWDDALVYTADGGGDNVQYSHRVLKDGRLATLAGDDDGLVAPLRIDSLGLAYGFATQALGFKINQHEGKLTGLAALGEPSLAAALAGHFRVDADGRIDSDFADFAAMRRFIFAWADGHPRETVAASVQRVLEDTIETAVRRLLALHGVRRLALAGGVFANVKLNQRLAETLPLDEIFVYPAMSDQGLAAGGVLDYLLARDGLATWLEQRYRLEHLYLGRDHGPAIDHVLTGNGCPRVATDTVRAAAELIDQGKIVALFTRGMEYGPRALGARSILAAPVAAEINHDLNRRLDRSEFMPFAPVVRASDASRIFALPPVSAYAARFMTITCQVRPEWASRIPSVVHVDGTARPQVIEREPNPLYHDIVSAYAGRSGIPVLINTSFNVHEEPIINTPAECWTALRDRRIDFVATDAGVYGRP
ncbi:MAG: hypothetical protein FJX61_01370 [Alphaproteobacteria bacterium]|nr:hypothetical protein [Alphaproteobacteria bacterium]